MPDTTKQLTLPTASQVAWADAEIGVIIHYDVQVFEPDYSFRERWGYTPDPAVFNPRELDTDQWIATAKSAGATYAVLVAKHCSGFSLWPTKAHPYSVASSPWRDGQGDIVGDFIASCKKYGVKPGIYASAACNAYLRVDNPGKVLTDDPAFLEKYRNSVEMQSGKDALWAPLEEQQRYNRIVETQLTELWSNYGPLFELWFDGGVVPPEKGGPSIIPLMQRLQPDAVVFGGPPGWPSLARFVGNERAEAPDPFWSTTDNLAAFDGTSEVAGLGGHPDGTVWSSGEADMPNRDGLKAFQGGWFWREGDDQYVFSLDHLVERYFTSVARNCNMLLGMVIDPRGLVPEVDRQRFAEFGERIREIHAAPIAKTSGVGTELILSLPEGRMPSMLGLMEDISLGQRVREYVVDAQTPDGWLEVCRGTSIGHKRLERFGGIRASALRLRVTACVDEPHIREFTAWEADPALFSVPMDAARRTKPAIQRDRNGMVRIVCANPSFKVRYTVDGSEPNDASPLYDSPFPLRDGGVVKAFCFVNDLAHSEITTAVFGGDRSDWTVVAVSLDSPFANGGHAGVAHLLNDDPAYYWHTYHTNRAKSAPPHEVTLDMGRERTVTAITFMPRDADGVPDHGEFYLSQDGDNWTLAADAHFEHLAGDPGMRLLPLETPQAARYLRFVARHILNDLNYVVVAGIGILEGTGK